MNSKSADPRRLARSTATAEKFSLVERFSHVSAPFAATYLAV
jgi:hypothetical protein